MVREHEQFDDKYEIPIWRKYTLSVQEASKYFHIGDKKLRKLIDEIRARILFSGTAPALRLSAEFLNDTLTKNCLPYNASK